MANEASVVVGSGLNPKKAELPFNQTSRERHLRGTSFVLLNPEDSSAGLAGQTTQITTSGSIATKLPTSPLSYRRAIAIRNNNESTGVVYVGFTSGITVNDGYPLYAGEFLPLDINGAVEIWGVSSTDVDVRIIELA